MPSDEEINVLEVMVEVLKHIYYLTDALSGEKDVTVSALRCILAHLKSNISPSSSDNHIASNMKRAGSYRVVYTLPKVSEVLNICSFLD